MIIDDFNPIASILNKKRSEILPLESRLTYLDNLIINSDDIELEKQEIKLLNIEEEIKKLINISINEMSSGGESDSFLKTQTDLTGLRSEKIFISTHLENAKNGLQGFEKIKEEKENIIAKITKIKSDIGNLLKKKERLDSVLAPNFNHCILLMKEKLSSIHVLEEATIIRKRLSDAPDKKTRFLIHKEIELKFGTDNLYEVISKSKTNINKCDRDIIKNRSRMYRLSEFHERNFSKVVIDGSNLCYSSEGIFIGIKALGNLIHELSKLYSVTVFFDYGILKMLGVERKVLVARFGKSISVCVSDEKTPADELILNFANNEDSFVISNDKFSDFPASQVILEKKVVGHHIYKDRIEVSALNININY